MSLYKDTVLQKVLETIQNNITGITSFYYGDPFLIPQSNLPALIIAKDTTTVDMDTTSEDRHDMAIVLTLVTDIRDSFADSPDNIAIGSNKLIELIEKRGSDYKLDSNTILYLLRHNADLDDDLFIDLGSGTTVDYGLVVGKRGESSISTEANVSFIVSHIEQRR